MKRALVIAAVAVWTIVQPPAAGYAAPHAAVAVDPPLLPFEVKNSSESDATTLYLVGHMLDAAGDPGPEGYVNAAGVFIAFPDATGKAPEPTTDPSQPGPASGAATDLNVPLGFSGRLYYSLDKKLTFYTVLDANNRTGLVQPASWNPADPASQVDVEYDWAELSYTEYGLFLNSSQVDLMSTPAAVSVTNGDGTRTTRGVTTSSVQQIADRVRAIPGFESSAQTDGGVLRLINPSHLVDSGRLSPDYLATYISNVWDHYSGGRVLTVRPFEDQPNVEFTGTVSGADGLWHFSDQAGNDVASFQRPTTADVFRCDGALHAPNDLTVGPIARSLCADFNRGVLGTADTSPVTDPTAFYSANAMNAGRFNYFAKFVHEGMRDGKAYAFAFDDVAHQESLVHSNDPVAASIDILGHGDPALLVDRVAGSDRFGTSVAVSEQGFPSGAPVVFVASGSSFPDALSAGPAAAKLGGPVLLTTPDALPAEVAAEITRLGAKKAIVVGGPAAVSPNVLAQVQHLVSDTVRIPGSDRFETSRAIARFAFPDGVREAVAATGLNYPDALAAGAAIGSTGPVILVNGGAGTIDAATREAFSSLGLDDLWVAGGTSVVSAGVYDQLSTVATAGRLAGSDRFETAEAINTHFFDTAGRVLLATGMNFPNALSGSAWAPVVAAPLFVVQSGCVPQGVLAQLTRLGATHVTLLGGTSTLSTDVESLASCP